MRVASLLALVVGAASASAQEGAGTLLRLQPRFGDTLRTWLEQQTEVTMMQPGSSVAPARSVKSTLTIHSRTVVRSVQPTSTTVLTIVDSAVLSSSDPHAAKFATDAQKALRGQQLLLQLASDGTVESARDTHGALVTQSVAEAMAAMPAVFPKKPVSVGETWTREMPLPSGGPLGAKGSGRVRTTFQFDSLQKGGAMAYVSMRGEILPDSSTTGPNVTGTISGTMQLDRVRGWMTDSRFAVTLRTLIAPASSGLSPMRFLTKVTQRLRTMDKR